MNLRGMKNFTEKIRGMKFFTKKIRGTKKIPSLGKGTPGGYPDLKMSTLIIRKSFYTLKCIRMVKSLFVA